MKIKTAWRRHWHDESTLDGGIKVYLEAWHDGTMDVGLIVVSYSETGQDADKRVLEKFSYVGDYRQTIRRAMGIWSKDVPRIIRTIRGESGQEVTLGEEADQPIEDVPSD